MVVTWLRIVVGIALFSESLDDGSHTFYFCMSAQVKNNSHVNDSDPSTIVSTSTHLHSQSGCCQMLALDPEREAVSSIHAHSNRRPRPGPPISPPTQHYTTNNNNKQPKQSGSRRSASASEDTSGLKARKALAYGPAYSAEEESLREDFALEYVHSGRRPQNFLLGCDLDKRFEECVAPIDSMSLVNPAHIAVL